MKIKILKDSIDVSMIRRDVENLLSTYDLWQEMQISLTSITGNDDWFACNGSMTNLEHTEDKYSILNKSLTNTVLGDIIREYSQFYRWRLLKLTPNKTYSVHSDGFKRQINKRIHIPVITNDRSFFCFYSSVPKTGQKCMVTHHHLQTGKIYELDTTGFHTAVNYGNTDRYHIVGVRYEDTAN